MDLPSIKPPKNECGKTETTVKDELFRIASLAKAARMVKANAEIRKDAYLEDITECVVRAMSKLQEMESRANGHPGSQNQRLETYQG